MCVKAILEAKAVSIVVPNWCLRASHDLAFGVIWYRYQILTWYDIATKYWPKFWGRTCWIPVSIQFYICYHYFERKLLHLHKYKATVIDLITANTASICQKRHYLRACQFMYTYLTYWYSITSDSLWILKFSKSKLTMINLIYTIPRYLCHMHISVCKLHCPNHFI